MEFQFSEFSYQNVLDCLWLDIAPKTCFLGANSVIRKRSKEGLSEFLQYFQCIILLALAKSKNLMGFFLILVLLFGAKFSCQRWSYDYWYFFKFLFYYLGQNSIERDGQMTKSILSEFLFYFLGQNSVVRSGQMTIRNFSEFLFYFLGQNSVFRDGQMIIRFFLNFCSIFWGKIQFSEMVK